MNRAQRRALERRLKKLGDQTLPSGRVIPVRELYDAMLSLWTVHGEEAYDKVLAGLQHAEPEVLVAVERVIEAAACEARTIGIAAA